MLEKVALIIGWCSYTGHCGLHRSCSAMGLYKLFSIVHNLPHGTAPLDFELFPVPVGNLHVFAVHSTVLVRHRKYFADTLLSSRLLLGRVLLGFVQVHDWFNATDQQ